MRGSRNLTILQEQIFDYLRAFTLVGGDVLYVSGCPGGSRLYRCHNQADELSFSGVFASVISQHHPSLHRLSKLYKVIILQRVMYNDRIKKLIQQSQKNHQTCIFETDDLIFDSAYYLSMDYRKNMTEKEQKRYSAGIGKEILEHPFVNVCVVSTDYLAQQLRAVYPQKRVFVSYNKIGKAQKNLADRMILRRRNMRKMRNTVVVSYFSGSKSHDKDFTCIVDTLHNLLLKNQNVQLRIVGYLELPEKLRTLEKQIEIFPYVGMKKMYELMASTDIAIAPLEKNNDFCEAKSAIKYMEAGSVGVPIVASNNPDFSRCIRNNENGFLASDLRDWNRFLLRLVRERKLREDIGEQARSDVERLHMVQKGEGTSYIRFLETLCKRSLTI